MICQTRNTLVGEIWLNERDTPRRSDGAFTRVELLAVLVVTALLCAVGLAAAGDGRAASKAMVCMGNLRQLGAAWLLYADENGGRIPPNANGANAGKTASLVSWVAGWLSFTQNLDNIETRFLIEPNYLWGGRLGPYLRPAPELFKCPSDESMVLIFGRYYSRVRSVSMNSSMNCYTNWNPATQYKVFRKLSDLQGPGPAKLWVILDEREDSINDGLFWMDPDNSKGQHTIVAYPGSYHSGGANLVFADGHVENWRWQDSRTAPRLVPGQMLQSNVASPENPDIARLQAASTYKP